MTIAQPGSGSERVDALPESAFDAIRPQLKDTHRQHWLTPRAPGVSRASRALFPSACDR